MKITPSTEQKKPNYPTLLVTAAAVVATAALTSCQQQQTPNPEQPDQATAGGVIIPCK